MGSASERASQKGEPSRKKGKPPLESSTLIFLSGRDNASGVCGFREKSFTSHVESGSRPPERRGGRGGRSRSRGPALYAELAKYYDRIYYWKNYRAEANKINKLVRQYEKHPCTTLLDIGCGTGSHITYLKNYFRCTGVDRSPEMLAVAREKLPDIQFFEGDMANLSLGMRFDVVTCLFSAVGYLRTKKQIKGAVQSFARHLNPGGVLIIEPWIRESDWRKGDVGFQSYKSDEVKIVRIDYGESRGNFSILDERYVIAKKNQGITYVSTKHVMRFFVPEEWLGVMRTTGLATEYLEESLEHERRLLVGVRQSEEGEEKKKNSPSVARPRGARDW
jgi:ubiquinone/menaquinone biosynthesis C-methylase UbiE